MRKACLTILSIILLSCNQLKPDTSSPSRNAQPITSSNPIWNSIPNLSSVISNSAILGLIDSSPQVSSYQIKYDVDTLLTKTDNNVTQVWLQEQNGIGILVLIIADNKILSFDRYAIKRSQDQLIKIDFSNLINGKTIKDVQISNNLETSDQTFSRIKGTLNPMYSQYAKSQTSVAICAQCGSALQDYKDALAQLLINAGQIGTGWAGQYVVALNATLVEFGSTLPLREIVKIALQRAFAGNVPNTILTVANAAWTTYQIYVSTKYIIALQNYEKCLRKYYNLNISDPNSCKLDSVGSLNPSFQRISSEVGKIITFSAQYTSSNLREVIFQTQSRGTPASIDPLIGSVSKGQTVKFSVLFECLAPGDFDVFIDVDFDSMLKPVKGSSDPDLSQRRTAQFTISCTDPYGIAVSIPAQVNLGQRKFGSATKQFIELSNLSRASMFFSVSGARDWLSLENANSLIAWPQSAVGFYVVGKCSNKPLDETISLTVKVGYAANVRITTKTYSLSVSIKCVGAPAISNVALEAAFDKLTPFGGDQANVLTFTNSGDANLEYAVSTTFSPTSPAWVVFTGGSGYDGQTGVAAPGQRVRIAVKGVCGNKVTGAADSLQVLFTVKGTAYTNAPVGYSDWKSARCNALKRIAVKAVLPDHIWVKPLNDDNTAYAKVSAKLSFQNVGPGILDYKLSIDPRARILSGTSGSLGVNQTQVVDVEISCKPYVSTTNRGDTFAISKISLRIDDPDGDPGSSGFPSSHFGDFDVHCGAVYKKSPDFYPYGIKVKTFVADSFTGTTDTKCFVGSGPLDYYNALLYDSRVDHSIVDGDILNFESYLGPTKSISQIKLLIGKLGFEKYDPNVCVTYQTSYAYLKPRFEANKTSAQSNLRTLMLDSSVKDLLYAGNEILDVTVEKTAEYDNPSVDHENISSNYILRDMKILAYPQTDHLHY